MAIKRENVRLTFYLTKQGVPDKVDVQYRKFDDTNPELAIETRHEDPITIDGTMTLNAIILAIRNALR